MAGERTLASLSNYRKRYQKADRKGRSKLLDEFEAQTGYHRKYAIALLRRPSDEVQTETRRRRRGVSYGPPVARALAKIWESAGCPWSLRLKALLPQWLPWARRHIRGLTEEVERALLTISPRQIDRLLADKKQHHRKRLYGHTKPGKLLKSQIPIRTDYWDVAVPGYVEIDLVVHCGPSASGEYICSLNVTDICTGWTETRAVMGKGEAGIVAALEDIRQCLPFALIAIDSDNGSEFINRHVVGWCQKHKLAFTRSRPYKKNDNAHIEQKNWTHVRRLLGWERYDTAEQCRQMNALYRNELSCMQNLFQPCVKLVEKVRVGSKVRRRYDAATTPLERLVACYGDAPIPLRVQQFLAKRENIDPFELSWRIDSALERLTRTTREKDGKEKEDIVS
jgi:transposase InsO family protein